MEELPEAVAAALAVIAYIELRVTSRVAELGRALEGARVMRREDRHEAEGRITGPRRTDDYPNGQDADTRR